MTFKYVASPYTPVGVTDEMERRSIMAKRYMDVVLFCGDKMRKGHVVFSPIAHCHDIANHCDLPKDYDFWKNYCISMLARAEELWVLRLSGWDTSKGIADELKFAREVGIRVRMIDIHEFRGHKLR